MVEAVIEETKHTEIETNLMNLIDCQQEESKVKEIGREDLPSSEEISEVDSTQSKTNKQIFFLYDRPQNITEGKISKLIRGKTAAKELGLAVVLRAL